MTFSERIRKNYKRSKRLQIIPLIIEFYFLLGIIALVWELLLSPLFRGVPLTETIGRGIIPWILFLILTMVPTLILFLLLRSGIRKLRTNNVEDLMKSLEPFGNPQDLIAAVDHLPPRDISGIDLRFDDQYLAFAKGRTIFIRRINEIRYFFDYAIDRNIDERFVIIIFAKGEPLTFSFENKGPADQIISELYEKSTFGKWIRTGELNHSYEPFVHTCPWNKNYRMECDGKTLFFEHKKGLLDNADRTYEIPLRELERCYIYYSPGGESADNFDLYLYQRDGQVEKIPLSSPHEGFQLYMRLLNCAPQLVYRYQKMRR